MKVTFIQPWFKNIWESVGIGYVIAYCKSKLKDDMVKFQVFNQMHDVHWYIIQECITSEIVAISTTTPTYGQALYLAKIIKEKNPKVHIVLGGWHPTTVHNPYREINNTYIDQVVVGEGECAFLEILNGRRKPFVMRGGKLTFDKLPWPDRDVINEWRQIDFCQSVFGERIASLQSTRGCRMNCAMCAESCMSGKFHKTFNPLRTRDPKDTLDEIEYLDRKFNLDRFKLLDPTWSVSNEVVFGFCEEKLRRNNKLKWDVEVHAAFITKEALEIMSRADCDVIMVGCESGSQKILNDIRKGTTVGKIVNVFDWAKEYGLKRRSFFMIGMPNEDLEALYHTYELIKRIKPDIFAMTFFTPYPGTDFYTYNKYGDIDWAKCDEYNNDFWESKHFTNKELKMFQRWFHRQFKDVLVHHKKDMI